MDDALMDTEGPSYMCSLPTELITTIFCNLPAKDLMKCGEVCLRWKSIVDALTYDEYLWRDHCQRDFCDIFTPARYKAKINLHAFQLYRSLSMWPKLATATEIRGEFSVATKVNEQIRSFRILGDGTVGVHKRGSIVYYNTDTFDPLRDREPITGDYSTYNENMHFVALLDYFQHLYLMRKSIDNPKMQPYATYDRVMKFVLINKLVYYITLSDEVYTTNADIDNLESTFVIKLRSKVLSLGFKERLHILTEHHDIFTLVNNKLVHITTISHDPSPLHQLQKHNIYDPFCWQTYFQTTKAVRLRDIVTVFKYGDIFFLGTCWGILHIYHAPFSSVRLDLGKTEPMKRYNFFEKDDVLLSSRCPILQVDVIETDTGHNVLVVMPRKVIVLRFVHNFIEPTYYSICEDEEEDP